MPGPQPLLFDCYYHIYNRGNNGENIFVEDRNYPYFLQLYVKHVAPIADTFTYCLLRNHFHLFVRIKNEEEQRAYHAERGKLSKSWPLFKLRNPSKQFANLFTAYAMAFNNAYGRTGSLFEKPFKRKLVDSDHYFTYLVAYIHRNPQTHGFVKDFRQWPWSSYRAMISTQPTRLQREVVLSWFGGRTGFEDAHIMDVDNAAIKPLIFD